MSMQIGHARRRDMGGLGAPGGEAQWRGERLVREGGHAALVFDGDVAVAGREDSSPGELPNMYHLKEYAGLDKAQLPPHMLLRRQELPAQWRRSRSASWFPKPDCERRAVVWWRRIHRTHRASGLRPPSSTAARSLFEKAGFSYGRSKEQTTA